MFRVEDANGQPMAYVYYEDDSGASKFDEGRTMKKRISIPSNAAEYEALDKRAGELVGCCENSQKEAELEVIADAMDAFDTMARLAPLLI